MSSATSNRSRLSPPFTCSLRGRARSHADIKKLAFSGGRVEEVPSDLVEHLTLQRRRAMTTLLEGCTLAYLRLTRANTRPSPAVVAVTVWLNATSRLTAAASCGGWAEHDAELSVQLPASAGSSSTCSTAILLRPTARQRGLPGRWFHRERLAGGRRCVCSRALSVRFFRPYQCFLVETYGPGKNSRAGPECFRLSRSQFESLFRKVQREGSA